MHTRSYEWRRIQEKASSFLRSMAKPLLYPHSDNASSSTKNQLELCNACQTSSMQYMYVSYGRGTKLGKGGTGSFLLQSLGWVKRLRDVSDLFSAAFTRMWDLNVGTARQGSIHVDKFYTSVSIYDRAQSDNGMRVQVVLVSQSKKKFPLHRQRKTKMCLEKKWISDARQFNSTTRKFV